MEINASKYLNTDYDVAFQALANPVRREILRILADHCRTANELAARIPDETRSMAYHLRTLRLGGLIEVEKSTPRKVYYRLNRGLISKLTEELSFEMNPGIQM